MQKPQQAAPRRPLTLIAASGILGLATVLAGCANPSASSRVYTFDQAQRAQTVTLGYVIGVRPVTIQAAQTSGLGVIVGGLILGLSETATGFFFSTGYKDVPGLLLLLLVLSVKPDGLLGKALIKKV